MADISWFTGSVRMKPAADVARDRITTLNKLAADLATRMSGVVADTIKTNPLFSGTFQVVVLADELDLAVRLLTDGKYANVEYGSSDAQGQVTISFTLPTPITVTTVTGAKVGGTTTTGTTGTTTTGTTGTTTTGTTGTTTTGTTATP